MDDVGIIESTEDLPAVLGRNVSNGGRRLF